MGFEEIEDLRIVREAEEIADSIWYNAFIKSQQKRPNQLINQQTNQLTNQPTKS